MLVKRVKWIALAAVTGLASVAGFAGAATVVASATGVKSGAVVDGWEVTFPSGIALISDGGSTLSLEKEAAFVSLEGLTINFTQVSTSASPTISIVDETLTNLSGSSWGDFQFLLASPLTTTPAAFDTTQGFTAAGLGPFTTSAFSTGVNPADTYTLGGGTVANGGTADLGFDSAAGVGGDLVIDANPTSTLSANGFGQLIDFKEIPMAGGNNGSNNGGNNGSNNGGNNGSNNGGNNGSNNGGNNGGVTVPLPASLWSGLTGLSGLLALAAFGKLRRKLA